MNKKYNQFWILKCLSIGVLACGASFLFYLSFGLSFIGCLTQPFLGFTFTDPEDFGPICLIIAFVPAIAIRHFVRPYPKWWLHFATVGAFITTAFTPVVYGTALLHLWLRAKEFLGHAPQVMIDDPKNICRDDAIYQHLYHRVNYAEAYVGALLYISLAFTLHLIFSRQFSKRRVIAIVAGLIAVFVVGWTVFPLSPSNLYAWWQD